MCNMHMDPEIGNLFSLAELNFTLDFRSATDISRKLFQMYSYMAEGMIHGLCGTVTVVRSLHS